LCHVFEERRSRHEKQIAGDRSAEVENAVVIAWWPADEHIFKHLLDCARRAAVADEIGAEFTLPGHTERHIGANDFYFPPVFFDDSQRTVRPTRLYRVIEFNVGQFGATNDAFLRLSRERIPARHVVQVFLDNDIAAASEGRVFVADQHGIDGLLPGRVFGPVDKPQQVAAVEIAKTVHLIDRRNGASEPVHDLRCQFEAKIHPLRPDMEQNVARGSDRVARSGLEFAKGMQFRRPWLAKEAIPHFGAEPHNAREILRRLAEADCPQKGCKIRAQRLHRGGVVIARVDSYDQKDRRTRQSRGYRLAN